MTNLPIQKFLIYLPGLPEIIRNKDALEKKKHFPTFQQLCEIITKG